MSVEATLWILLPVCVAAGTAILVYLIMSARLEVAVGKEREQAAEARTMVEFHQKTLDDKLKATEETVRRKAFEDFLNDIRVEERHYVKAGANARRTLMLQQRLFFRNIPLSNWMEHEVASGDAGESSRSPESAFFESLALGSDRRASESHRLTTAAP